MKYEILHQPSFSVARLMMEPGDSIRAESGSMVSMSPTITMESKMHGGIGKAIGRLFGGESLFQTTFTASHGPGELLLAPTLLGDLVPIQLSTSGMMITSGCFLASELSVELETKANLKNFFAGEGLFLLRASGAGFVLVSCFGAIYAVDLQPGQPYCVDTGHIVAFSDSMQFEVRRAAKSLIGSFTSGEGYVAHFSGPGRLYVQTRSPQGFGSWMSQFVPRGS